MSKNSIETRISDQVIAKALSLVTPTPTLKSAGKTPEQKIERITSLMAQVLEELGLDLSDDSLKDTPRRIAKMYVNEIFWGLDEKSFPKMTVISNKMEYEQMVQVRGIKVMSMCEHHFMPIHGVATVAYIPNKKVVGLSKINRLVDYFCRRPQVQERLTKQIADMLRQLLQTEHVAVHIEAKHYCVIARGVEDVQSTTVTTDLRGHFLSLPHTRQEFLSSVSRWD